MDLVLLFILIITLGTLLRPALSWIKFSRHFSKILKSEDEDFQDDIVAVYTITIRKKIYETFQKTVARKMSHEESFKEIAEYLSSLFECDSYSVLLTPKDGEWSFMAWSKNLDKVNLRSISKALKKAPQSNITDVLESKDVVYISDTKRYEQWKSLETPVRTWLGVPLIIGGEVIGVINLDWFEPGKARNYIIESLRRVVQDLEKILNSMEEFRSIIFETDIDILLGIPNKNAFEKFARVVEIEGKRVGVILIDLDRFKRINEVYGHSVGNEVLKRIKDRIMSNVRREDKFFRYGGDEFVLVVEDPTVEKMEVVSRKIKHVFLRVFEIDKEGVPVFVKLNAKVGWAIYPDESQSMSEALENAKKRLM